MKDRYRCPYPDCNETFEDGGARPGRPLRCPVCGRAMNARPLAMAEQLAQREAALAGAPGLTRPCRPLIALVDNVRSLWNVGSIFRTADACGLRELVLTGITANPPREAIAKTALGAELAVAWRYRAEPLAALAELQDEGWNPVAVEATDDAVALDAFDWPERCCIVVGNEVHGVSPELLAACPRRVAIPMDGVKDSLNVAVAFGIAVYAASRRAKKSPAHEAPGLPDSLPTD